MLNVETTKNLNKNFDNKLKFFILKIFNHYRFPCRCTGAAVIFADFQDSKRTRILVHPLSFSCGE